jgi:MarR family 2-MHQ and catechol resistance regulon transcriptional repressor
MVLEALLHKGPLTISEIQAKVLFASGSMTAAVDRVKSMGLVVRKTTAQDRRARLLELTSKGRRLIERAFAEHARHLENAISILDDEEKRCLYAGLRKLGHSVAATLDRPHSEQKTNKGYLAYEQTDPGHPPYHCNRR